MYNSQNIANLIKLQAKNKDISISKMLEQCELSKNTLSSMTSGGFFPRLIALAKIADYLNCSMDYLMGRTDVVEINTQEKDTVKISELQHLIDKSQSAFIAAESGRKYEAKEPDVATIHKIEKLDNQT